LAPVGDDTGLLEVFEEFARKVNVPSEVDGRLHRAVEMLAEMIPACSAAGVTFVLRGEPQTVAATSELVRRADELQYALDEGPCLEAVRGSHTTVISNDVPADQRWPRWGTRAAEDLGIGSVMSVLLYTEQHSYGALKLYATRTGAFDPEDSAVAEALAAHLAVAIDDAREIENRSRAMVTRTVIGQAEGILMERLKIDADQAFEYLRRVSSQTNEKLVAVATELVRTGRLPNET
jgi:GAF domain-containing protein